MKDGIIEELFAHVLTIGDRNYRTNAANGRPNGFPWHSMANIIAALEQPDAVGICFETGNSYIWLNVIDSNSEICDNIVNHELTAFVIEEMDHLRDDIDCYYVIPKNDPLVESFILQLKMRIL